ncbi:hypothetical protein G7Y79_00006g017930 [Physcia stellaris]|nr:hypothetical protein G7Y79_00006g017930 [Physcia stellaris]
MTIDDAPPSKTPTRFPNWYLHQETSRDLLFVSNLWCSIASIYLFEKLYVSANQEDLDVFQAVAEHPSLRQHVRTLSYDGAIFCSDLKRRDYTCRLFCTKPPESFFGANDSTYIYPDRDIEEWIRHTPITPSADPKWKMFRKCKFINDGLNNYRDHADMQRELLTKGKFLKILVDGLKRLDSLQSITVRSGWERLRNLDECHTGSPLARSWDIFHLTPESWAWTMEDSSITDGAHYELITSALVEAQRYIQSFDINDCKPTGISANVFASVECLRADSLAFAQLRSLSLILATPEVEPSPMDSKEEISVYDFVPGLSMLLGSMPNLAHLRLIMPSDFSQRPLYYRFRHIFPEGTQWDKLESITLQNLAITANQFMDLVTKRTPNLRRLTIAALDLLEGRWECVFQALSELKSPLILDFIDERNNYMTHCEGDNMWQNWYPLSLWKEIGSYVTNGGGRHPCLPDGQPDSAAAHLFRLDTA